ncbi:hypothetical protein HK104_002784 [Borealophlyctis nickersoniae]|nr:hypothetical protein HK104_002784 [Borealophlyctis nickersoniae]
MATSAAPTHSTDFPLLAEEDTYSTDQPPLKLCGLSCPAKYVGYLGDWLTALCILLLSAIVSEMEPFHRPIDLKNPELSHPHLPDIVPSWAEVVVTLGFPPIILCLCHMTATYARRKGQFSSARTGGANLLLRDLHHLLLGLSLSFAAAKLSTDILKMWAGRFRPDFLDRCKWDPVLGDCTGDPNVVKDGRRSFPSGHSSNAFAGMGFLSLWVAGHLGVLSGWGGSQGGGRAWRVMAAVMPLFPASYIAISRSQQYIHFPTDIAFGIALGMVWAVIFYAMFYRAGQPRELPNTQAHETEIEDV